MKKIGELYQSACWETGKHLPAIECSHEVNADEMFDVKATPGKEIDFAKRGLLKFT